MWLTITNGMNITVDEDQIGAHSLIHVRLLGWSHKSSNNRVSAPIADPAFLPGLLPFDLTRGGKPFLFHGHTDIKQEAFYAQDSLTSSATEARLCLNTRQLKVRIRNWPPDSTKP
ncbi:MAG: hypothetical protein QOH71_2351 [Blastocatellia bacterium]|jgi:hypothetical protein|nr:hypothetical protein [Blastocatellia bacterium]